jgi:hypothetical protein
VDLSEIFTSRAIKLLRRVGDAVFPVIKEPDDDAWTPNDIRTVAAGLRAYADEVDGLAAAAEADLKMLDELKGTGE